MGKNKKKYSRGDTAMEAVHLIPTCSQNFTSLFEFLNIGFDGFACFGALFPMPHFLTLGTPPSIFTPLHTLTTQRALLLMLCTLVPCPLELVIFATLSSGKCAIAK